MYISYRKQEHLKGIVSYHTLTTTNYVQHTRMSRSQAPTLYVHQVIGVQDSPWQIKINKLTHTLSLPPLFLSLSLSLSPSPSFPLSLSVTQSTLDCIRIYLPEQRSFALFGWKGFCCCSEMKQTLLIKHTIHTHTTRCTRGHD